MSKILARMFQFAFSIPSCQSNESKIFHYQWFGMVFLTKTLSKCSSSFSRVFSYIRWQNRTHPKFFSTGRGKPYSTRAKESGSTSKVAPVFFLGGNQQRKQNTSQKKTWFLCVPFLIIIFVHVVFSICFQRLFLILCIFSLNYYTKWLIVPVRKAWIMGHSCPCNRVLFHAVYTFRCRLELLSIST